jgi:hypothetical protein
MLGGQRRLVRSAVLLLAATAATIALLPSCSLDWSGTPDADGREGDDVAADGGDVPADDARPGDDAGDDAGVEADGGADGDADGDTEATDEGGEADSTEATDGGCTGDPGCPDDGNPCNGTEYCRTSDGTCRHRDPPADGTSCGSGMVCGGGLCVPINCGNGRVEPPEECDDGNPVGDDGCETDCTFSCHAGPDCDDGAICNGVESCTSEHRCVAGAPAASGTDCSDGIYCDGSEGCNGGGACVSFGVDPCNDGFVCTQDVCSEATLSCSHPPVADMTACAGGLCCGGVCRTGAVCCAGTDCPMFCSGMATPCADLSAPEPCNAQDGCSVVTSGNCSTPPGSTRTCNFSDSYWCGACGCSWEGGLGMCNGSGPTACPGLDSTLCSACGCTWTLTSAACEGMAWGCAAFTDGAACMDQRGCTWAHRTCNTATWRCL